MIGQIQEARKILIRASSQRIKRRPRRKILLSRAKTTLLASRMFSLRSKSRLKRRLKRMKSKRCPKRNKIQKMKSMISRSVIFHCHTQTKRMLITGLNSTIARSNQLCLAHWRRVSEAMKQVHICWSTDSEKQRLRAPVQSISQITGAQKLND